MNCFCKLKRNRCKKCSFYKEVELPTCEQGFVIFSACYKKAYVRPFKPFYTSKH